MGKKSMRLLILIILTTTAMALLLCTAWANGLTPKERLGKKLFFDTSLSTPSGQSCAACHAPQVGGYATFITAVTYISQLKADGRILTAYPLERSFINCSFRVLN